VVKNFAVLNIFFMGYLKRPSSIKKNQISTLILDLFYGGGSLLISHEKYIKDGKVLAHLGFQSMVFPGSLTDLSAWVGFCTSSPQQGVKYQH
jgi:hypothetical protein